MSPATIIFSRFVILRHGHVACAMHWEKESGFGCGVRDLDKMCTFTLYFDFFVTTEMREKLIEIML